MDDWVSVKKKPLPLNTVIQLRFADESICEHAVKYEDGLFCNSRKVDAEQVICWRLKPAATFRFPGDAPGTWQAAKSGEREL